MVSRRIVMPSLSRRVFVLGGIALLGAIIFAGTALAQPDRWFQVGEAYKAANGDGRVVARVDGLPITQFDLRIGKALADLNNGVSPNKVGTDERSVLQRLISDKAL